MDDKNLKQQNSFQHKCPNCGAPLRFDPKSGKLFCNHCESELPFEVRADVVERDFEELATFDNLDADDVACYRCENCGAVSVTPRNTLATLCPYCKSPVVIDDITGGFVKPDTAIPFELTKEDAAAQLKTWRKRRIFAPRKFRKQVKEGNITGIFVPSWTFDAKTSSGYSGRVGYNRTRTVRRNGKTYTETYVEWRHISGVFDMDFDDIIIRAGDNIDGSSFNKITTFYQDKYRRYTDEFLAGYIAEQYTVEPLDAFEQAKGMMMGDIRRGILNRYHADVEGEIDVDMNILGKSFKYLLVPVYVVAGKYNNKVYNQYVSGVFSDDEKKKAKVAGNFPVSPWKVLFAVLLGLGIVGLLSWLILRASEGGTSDDVYWQYGWNVLQHLLK